MHASRGERCQRVPATIAILKIARHMVDGREVVRRMSRRSDDRPILFG
jgi:hypothetical protein